MLTIEKQSPVEVEIMDEDGNAVGFTEMQTPVKILLDGTELKTLNWPHPAPPDEVILDWVMSEHRRGAFA